MKSNLNIQSNLMVEDEKQGLQHRYLPGDFVAVVYPEKVDARVIDKELTQNQIIEYKQYLKCSICGRPCAGTCDNKGQNG